MMTKIEMQYMDAVIQMNRRQRDNEPDWEQRRYEIAKDMMAAIINNPDIAAGIACEPKTAEGVPVALARVSLEFADTLVDELKKAQENK